MIANSFRLYDLTIPIIVILTGLVTAISCLADRVEKEELSHKTEIVKVPIQHIGLLKLWHNSAIIFVLLEFCFVICSIVSSILAAIIAANEVNVTAEFVEKSMLAKIIFYSVLAIFFSTIENIVHAKDVARAYRLACEKLNQAILFTQYPEDNSEPNNEQDSTHYLHNIAKVICECEVIISNATYNGKWS